MVGIQLFFSFFKIGLLAIGGAYSFLPLFQEELVESRGWISEEEFAEIIAITEIFPGAKSVKFATYAGNKMMGIPGVIIANLGNLLPPAIIILLVSKLYAEYKDHPRLENSFLMAKYAVIGLIIAVAVKMVEWKVIVQYRMGIVFVGSFVFGYFLDVHPALIIIIAGLLGLVMA